MKNALNVKSILLFLLTTTISINSAASINTNSNANMLAMYTYGKSNLNGKVDKEIFQKAVNEYLKTEKKKNILTFIDYTKPSTEKRLYVFNMDTGSLLYHTYVSHGKGSGMGKVPKQFSNNVESWQTSLGTFVTTETYFGKNGYSLVLEGKSGDLNSNAKKRYIVFHGADYSEKAFIEKHGQLGTSHGCPAVPKSLSKDIINTIKEGSVIYSHGVDEDMYNLPIINMPQKVAKLAKLFSKS